MKFNWGHGLLLAIALSSLGFIVLVILSSRQQIDFVTEEYYPKGLVYDNEIEKLTNTSELKDKISVQIEEDNLVMHFPGITDSPKDIEGKIWLYYPADKKEDRFFITDIDSAFNQIISIENMKRGKYLLIFDWSANGKEYLQKEQVFIK